MIDVVIPTHVKDAETLELCIEHVKKNVMNLNKVYIVSKDKLTDNTNINKYEIKKRTKNKNFIMG